MIIGGIGGNIKCMSGPANHHVDSESHGSTRSQGIARGREVMTLLRCQQDTDSLSVAA